VQPHPLRSEESDIAADLKQSAKRPILALALYLSRQKREQHGQVLHDGDGSAFRADT
jgi:hypothetical protein